jgi:F-type H+-transporting ATPase subunit delta
MDKIKINAIVEGFWKYLKKEGDLELLPEILQGLASKMDETSSIARVQSGTVLSEKQKNNIIKIIKLNLGINTVEFEVDTSLIGGIKIKIGDKVLDLSVQGKLNHLLKSI